MPQSDARVLDRLDVALARLRRTNDVVGVLFVEVDRFGIVNEALGEPCGDWLAATLADRLCSDLGDAATVMHLSGGDYVVITEGAGQPAGLTELAQHLLDTVAVPFVLPNGITLVISASVGVAVGTSPDDHSPRALLQEAHEALRSAERAGPISFASAS